MDWVWNHSASKGTARMVLLAIADKCPGVDCSAYAGTAMLMQRTNASRSSVRASVDKLINAGELSVSDGGKGPRGETIYQIPRAVGHVRSTARGRRRVEPRPGFKSGPDQEEAPKGPESGEQGEQPVAPWGPESDPQNARNHKQHKEQQPREASRDLMSSEPVLQLTKALQAEGLSVRWNLVVSEQLDVERLIRNYGVTALVEVVARRTVPGDVAKPARYWLRAWADLDQASSRTTSTVNVVPLLRSTRGNHSDALKGGLALLAMEGSA